MAEVSRTRRSAQNVLVGVTTQILTLALSFVTRTVFISVLGVELLGVNQLLISILAMLAIADLGVSAALMYALYPAIASRDNEKIAAITQYAATVYRWIAIAVAIGGIAVLPVLDLLVSMEDPPEQLWIYYLVLLANTVAAYLMQYRKVLLDADQRMYITKVYALGFSIARNLAQIAALVVYESFLLHLVLQTVFTVANNLALYLRIGELYPFLKRPLTCLDRESRRGIRESVRAMIIYRAGGLVLNNSDPILISVIVGTVALGYYANYSLIVGALMMVIEIAFLGLAPSVGNLMATSTADWGRRVFFEMNLLAVTVYGGAAALLVVVLDDLVALWLGSDFSLGLGIVLLVAGNFYATGIAVPVWSFRAATGMFKKTRYVMLLNAILNVVLSVALGFAYGLAGILGATLISRIVSSAWYEPLVLFRGHLNGGARKYLQVHLVALCGLIGVAAATYALSPGGVSGGALAIDLLVGGSLLAVFFGLFWWQTEEGRALWARGRSRAAFHS